MTSHCSARPLLSTERLFSILSFFFILYKKLAIVFRLFSTSIRPDGLCGDLIDRIRGKGGSDRARTRDTPFKFMKKAHLCPPTLREILYSSSEPKKLLRFGHYFALMGLGNILKFIPIENISMGIVL